MTDNFCRLLRIPIIQDVLIRILLPDNSYWVKGALAKTTVAANCRTSWLRELQNFVAALCRVGVRSNAR